MRLSAPSALAVLLFATGASGCRSVRNTLDEASELLVSGGERVLREPMRPIRGTRRVLVLAFDGVGDGVLRAALADGDLPALSALLGTKTGDDLWAHAYAAPGVVSVFPAETTAGWAAVYTGRPAAETGVPGNEWFVRDSLAVFAPVPLSVRSVEQTLSIYTDDLLGEIIQTPTLFERAGVRSHVSMGFVSHGADLLTPPDFNDVGDLAEAAVGALFGGSDEAYEEVDDDTVEGVARGFERYGVPDLQIAYFPGTDLAAHAAGADAQRDYLRTETAQDVERILALYRERGLLETLTLVVVSDHGHTESLADERHSLGGDDKAVALLDALGRRRRDFSLAADSSDFDVVMGYNEATAFRFLADRSTCPEKDQVCDWSRPPRLEQDVLPVARAFRDASARPASTPADSAAAFGIAGALDLVLARASDPSGATRPPFRVLDGERLVPVGEYLRRHPRPDLPRFEERLAWLTEGPLGHRAGDVVLMAKAGAGRPIEERFYFGAPRASGHGSASASDALIPLVVARPSSTGEVLRAEMRAAVGERPTQLDVTDLILALLAEPDIVRRNTQTN